MLINPAAEFAYMKHFFFLETICKKTPKTKTQRVRERDRDREKWNEENPQTAGRLFSSGLAGDE